MKVVVSGGTGVIGRSAVRALVSAGHEVDVVARSVANVAVIEGLGGRARRGDLFDADSLIPLFADADVVVNLATNVPVGYAAAWPTAWRRNDDLRNRAVEQITRAARAAGVRRIVQESATFIYADKGDAWIAEHDPIDITPATEPLAVSESFVQDFAGGSRTGVIVRFGTIIGEDPLTRFWLRAAGSGRPTGIGRAEQWSHLIHTDDLGPAIVAALQAPSGVYNVGAAPVRRGEVVDGFAQAAGVASGAFLGPVLRRLAGYRVEPMTRSLRVSSEHFVAQTGWQPQRPAFGLDWLGSAVRQTEGVG